jgi:uncharacterized protein with HEPN domain
VTRRDRLYFVHIAECVERIESYTAEGKEPFLGDTKTQDAVLRNLEVIAEATKRMSDEAKAAHPEIEWRGIVAMRNLVLHEYPDVNPERVWEVVEQEIPRIKSLRPPEE